MSEEPVDLDSLPVCVEGKVSLDNLEEDCD